MSPESNPTSIEAYVDAARASAFLSVSRKTLLALARNGRIPAHPLAEQRRKIWRFRLSELEAWIGSTSALNSDSHRGRNERKIA